MTKQQPDKLPEKEAEKLRDEVLKKMLQTPPKPHKPPKKPKAEGKS